MRKSFVIVAILVFIGKIAIAQNIGIGTASPIGRLHVKGNADSSQLIIDANNTQGKVPLIRLRNAWGEDRMHIHSDSSVNAFVGLNAGKENTASVFLGGIYNTAVGSEASRINVSGVNNTALGYRSLYANTGGYNTAAGAWALTENSSGEYNAAFGTFSMRNNYTGNSNTASGFGSLRSNVSGNNNTAVGYNALYFSTSGGSNTAVGSGALQQNNGFGNTAVGKEALSKNAAGVTNTAVGEEALKNNTNGYDNVAIGWLALQSNTTGYGNIAIGALSGTSNVAQFYNTISIGNNNYQNGYHNQAFLGNLNMTWNGGNVGWSTFSDARIKTSIEEGVKGLDFIMRLRPVTYYRNIEAALNLTGNKDERSDYPAKHDLEKIKFSGFLAQEVELAARAAGYDFNGVQTPKSDKQLYTLTYETFVVPLVKAVQEQQAMIDSLRKSNADLLILVEEHQRLMSRLDKLEKLITTKVSN